MTLPIEKESPPLRVDETGTVRIGASRVTLDVVVDAFRSGESPEAIAEDFDTISLAEVYAAIGYYLRHQKQLDAYLAKRDAEADAMQREAESKPDYKLWRERLLERAKQRGLRT
jgi:uncharacterized protein (DUF433 family)